MLYGAIQYWKLNIIGLKILFWISLSLVPIIITPVLVHVPKITTGIFFYVQNVFRATGVGFNFHVAEINHISIPPFKNED